MPIFFDDKSQIIKLDTLNSSYVIKIFEEGYLLNLYYGAKIPDSDCGSAFDGAHFRDWFSSFSPSNPNVKDGTFSADVAPMEYSGFGSGDFRTAAVAIRNAAGDDITDFRYIAHRIYAGKPKLEQLPSLYLNDESEADTLEIDVCDKITGAEATLIYTAFKNHSAITKSVKIRNASDKPFEIERAYSSSFSLPTMDYDFIHFYGKWGSERNYARSPLDHGTQAIYSARGSSSHYHNPFAAFAAHGADEEHGEVYGVNLVYSGNFKIEADCDFYACTRINVGINPDGFGWYLEPGEEFQTPEAVLVYSNDGIGEMSRTYHRLYLNNLISGRYKTEKRPLLINSWEAAYFNFDTDKLVSFAERAKELGIDMLVMDDGWFGHRNNDWTSLGDWYVNEDKLKGGLGVLIDRVNALGLKFGIWYEPEMISPDSDLYRAHPDWCIHAGNRDRSIARHQYVLDMSRKEVRDNIFEQMKAVLSKYKIDYVKWDFNRNLTEVACAEFPAERQKEIFHRFTLGTYELMNRLMTEFPNLLIENCSGGGGRFDAGMLYYSPQIWASDNTDPIDRLAIQYGTSYCYPASAMGAHVSMCRRTGFETKGNVAIWGTFGYELDPNHLNDKEKEIVKKQVEEYHKYYELIHYGDLYRVVTPFENPYYCAWEFVSPDKKEMLFTCVTMREHINTYYIQRFKGLDPNKNYVESESGRVYSGSFLMNVGLNLSGKPQGTGESFKLYFTETE